MSDILLNDILGIKNEDLNRVKIRFNLSNKSWDALRFYKENRDTLLVGHFHNVLKGEIDGKYRNTGSRTSQRKTIKIRNR